MKVVALGDSSFVSAFRLAGSAGLEVSDVSQAEKELTRLVREEDVGVILVSDAMGEEIRRRINRLRAEHAVPLIYEVPAPGQPTQEVEYREVLRDILGV